jgi:acetylglutamate kinase
MSAEIAIAMAAHKMLLMTDTPGVMNDINDKNSLIPELNSKEAQELINKKIAQGGMIPKLECCIDSIKRGVKEAIILNGLEEHCLLLETFTNRGSGTRIVI